MDRPRVINNDGLRNKMNEKTVVVVFPSLFSLNKIDYLISSIHAVLKTKKLTFSKIRKNDSVIIVEAEDPVFASSAINYLFGIEKIAIAKKEKVVLTKAQLKQKVKELRTKREEALQQRSWKMAEILRRRISRLKKKTRRAA